MGHSPNVIGLVFVGVVCCLSSNLCAKELDFGRVQVGSSQMDSVYFRNDRLVTFMVTNLSFSNPVFGFPARAFTPGHVSLDPGEQWALPVFFRPLDTGVVNAQLQMETNQGGDLWHLLGDGVREVVVINEVLADPASGDLGDANGDGIRQSNQDEFVEVLNTGKYTLDIGGWELFDAGASSGNRFRFPTPTYLGPGQYVVVFGGGNVSGEKARVFFDDGKIGGGLRNSGDEVILFDPATQLTMARMAYGAEGGKNQSLVRSPEGVGPWTLHKSFPGKGALQSPGKPRIIANLLEVTPKIAEISWGDTLLIDARVGFQDDTYQEVSPDELQVTFDVLDAFEDGGAGKWVAKQGGEFLVFVGLHNMEPETLSVVVGSPRVVAVALHGVDSLMLVDDHLSLDVVGTNLQSKEFTLTEHLVFAVGDTTVLNIEQARLRARAPGRAHVSVVYEGLTSSQAITVVDRGDLNQDGQFTLWDAVKVVNLILGKDFQTTEFERRSADLNQDGHIDIRDLIAVIQKIVGGPVVSSKPGVAMGELGWQMSDLGLLLTVPYYTVALTFEGRSELAVHGLQTEVGQIYFQTKTPGFSGVVLVEAMPLEVLPTREVLVKGIVGQEQIHWTAWTLDGVPHVLNEKMEAPGALRLISGHPNPGNPSVTIQFAVPFEQQLTLDIFRIDGQWVRQLVQNRVMGGKHQVVWDARDALGREVASGVYFAHLKSARAHSTLKLMVLR